MTNANTFHSSVIVLIIFAAVYFAALGVYEIKKKIREAGRKRQEMAEDAGKNSGETAPGKTDPGKTDF